MNEILLFMVIVDFSGVVLKKSVVLCVVSPNRAAAVVARLAARDMRSTVGANLALIRQETGLDP